MGYHRGMTTLLAVSAALITLALVAYTLGVWAERLRRRLEPWHVAAFWTGLALDSAGTIGMSRLAAAWNPTALHSITGQVAIALMLAHAAWATWIVTRGSEQARGRFHRLSVAVWAVWLVPYFAGMALGMRHLG